MPSPYRRAAGGDDPLFNPLGVKTSALDKARGVAAIAGRVGNNPQSLIPALQPAFDMLQYVLRGEDMPKRSIFDAPMVLGPSKGDGLAELSGPLATSSTFAENLLLEYANGFTGAKLGWGRLSESNLRQMLALHGMHAELTRRTPYLARSRGSNLLSHVVRSIEQSITATPVARAIGIPGDKVLIVAGHDTNLSNLSGMLGLSWLIDSYQPDETPPGGALGFSVWKSAGGEYGIRTQFVAQTLDQIHKATPLSLSNPPAVAPVFVPGCGTPTEGFVCAWAKFKETALQAIDSDFVLEDGQAH